MESERRRRRTGVYIYSCNYIYAHNMVMKEEQKLVTRTHCIHEVSLGIHL
jgi:hypothetical protein